MQNNLSKKILVCGIIVLFIGVTVAPGITAVDLKQANLSKISTFNNEIQNDELVEITVSICEIDGIENHIVMLTRQQISELDNLFGTIKEKLDDTETMEETITIFHDTALSLDELGLLPEGMSVEQAEQLMFGRNQVSIPWLLETITDDSRSRLENEESMDEIVVIINDVIVLLDEHGLLPDDISVEQVQQLVISNLDDPRFLKFEKMVDDIENKLENAETMEEKVAILNDAIVELDKYGLLGGLSVEQAQRLVTKQINDHKILELESKNDNLVESIREYGLPIEREKIKESIHSVIANYLRKDSLKQNEKSYEQNSNDEENHNCLIVGKTSQTAFWSGISHFQRFLALLYWFYLVLSRVLTVAFIFELIYSILHPIFPNLPSLDGIIQYIMDHMDEEKIYNMLNMLTKYLDLRCNPIMNMPPLELNSPITLGIDACGAGIPPAEGWVWTKGTNGIKEWNGSFYGTTGYCWYFDDTCPDYHLEGVQHFTGIRFYFIQHQIPDLFPIFIVPRMAGNAYYIGHASFVKIGPEPYSGFGGQKGDSFNKPNIGMQISQSSQQQSSTPSGQTQGQSSQPQITQGRQSNNNIQIGPMLLNL